MQYIVKKKFNSLISLYFYFLVVAIFAVLILPWWPFDQWLIIPKYILLFGPRWWILVVMLPVVFLWRHLSKKKRLLLPILLIGVMNYLDFQLPSLTGYFQPKNDANTIKIIQANIGGDASIYEIQLLINDEKPDIVLLQEANNINFTSWISPEYRTSCKGGLCIVSKLDFEEVGELNRKLIDRWGNFGLLYKIKIGQSEFSLANVHFETPRTVIKGLIHRNWKQSSANKLDSDRQYEALLISSWQQAQKNAIIVGDFNMLEDENIYQKYFSKMNNALGRAAIGLLYTKKTSWHGVRIDHLLFTNNFTVKDVRINNSITGDHKPVITTLNFNNKLLLN